MLHFQNPSSHQHQLFVAERLRMLSQHTLHCIAKCTIRSSLGAVFDYVLRYLPSAVTRIGEDSEYSAFRHAVHDFPKVRAFESNNGFFTVMVLGNERAMAAKMEEQNVARLGLIHHPPKRRLDVGGSGHDRAAWFVHHELNVTTIKPKPLNQHISHRQHIIVASV
nr:hypothetical protein VITISV_010768 [Ipomoea batatas]